MYPLNLNPHLHELIDDDLHLIKYTVAPPLSAPPLSHYVSFVCQCPYMVIIIIDGCGHLLSVVVEA